MQRYTWLSAALMLTLGSVTPARASTSASAAIAPIPKPPADSNLQQDEIFDLIVRIANFSTGPDINTSIPATLKAGSKLDLILACKDTSCVTPLPGTLTFQDPGGNGCVDSLTGVASCTASGSNTVIITVSQDIVLPPFPASIDIATVRLKATAPVTNPVTGAFNLVATTEDILNIQACTTQDGCVSGGAAGTTPFTFPTGITTPTPTPTRTPTPTPTPTRTPTPTPTPTLTPAGPTPTPAPPTPTPVKTPTPRPTPSATSGPPTVTPAPTPTAGPPCDDGKGGGRRNCEVRNPYKNETGISTATVPPGMALNPGSTGQWLWGAYYDVRPVRNLATGASDPQDVNIQISNTNPRSSSFDCFNPYGGLIAKVRFRESKTSREVLNFDIVLSCAEVWTGKVELRPGESLPTIVSSAPILTSSTSSQFTTGPDLESGRQFNLPPGLEPEDVQRGYFEVIAEEALPCEPIDCQVVPSGNVWNRLPAGNRTPTNALSAEVILIRVSAGISYVYSAEAVTRYVAAGGGSVFTTLAGKPNVTSCIAQAGQDCLDQMDFILAKSRVTAQYDIQEAIGGATRVVFTMPTKNYHCTLNSGKSDFDGIGSPPYSCEGADTENPKVGGERVGCVPYNRLEDKTGASCKLPREMSIVGIVAEDSSTAANMASVSDELIDVTSIPRDHLSGSVDFNLVRDPATGPSVLHQLKLADVNLLGAPYSGFNGLPVLTLTLQEYLNATLQPVGVYGGAAATPYDVEYLD